VPQAQGRLLEKRVLSLDMAALLAGTQYRGSFEERLHGVIDEVQQSQRRVILFIDEIHTVVGAGQVMLLVLVQRHPSYAKQLLYHFGLKIAVQLQTPIFGVLVRDITWSFPIVYLNPKWLNGWAFYPFTCSTAAAASFVYSKVH
jgi:hypothetical protein